VLFWQGGNKAQDLEKMRQLGLNVELSEPRVLEDVAKELIILGKLTNNLDKAKAVARQYLQTLTNIRQGYQDKATIDVFYQLWSSPLMTINQDSWINQLITSCNAENVFADSSSKTPQVSIENIIVAKPQVIVIPDASATKPQPDINWQQWRQIPAVKEKQIIHVNGDVMHRFSPAMLEGLSDMCQQLDQFR